MRTPIITSDLDKVNTIPNTEQALGSDKKTKKRKERKPKLKEIKLMKSRLKLMF